MDIRALVGSNSPVSLPSPDPATATHSVKLTLLNTVIAHANAALPHFPPQRNPATWILKREPVLETSPETKDEAVGFSLSPSRDPANSEREMWERDPDVSTEQFLTPALPMPAFPLKDTKKVYNKTITRLLTTVSPGLKPQSKPQKNPDRRPRTFRPRPLSTRPASVRRATERTELMDVTGRPWLYSAYVSRPTTVNLPVTRHITPIPSSALSVALNQRGLSSGTDFEALTDSFSPLTMKPKYTGGSKDYVKAIDVKIPTPELQEDSRKRPESVAVTKRHGRITPNAEDSVPSLPLIHGDFPSIPELPPLPGDSNDTEVSSPDKIPHPEQYLPPTFLVFSSKRPSEVPRNSEHAESRKSGLVEVTPEPETHSTLATMKSHFTDSLEITTLVNSQRRGSRPRSGVPQHGRLIKGKVPLSGIRSSGRAVRCVHLMC